MTHSDLNQVKAETSNQLRARWQANEVVNTYENVRYGNIKRSLAHYLDCDAIDSFLKGNFGCRDMVLLDLACGTGRLTRTINRANRRIISADYSEQMLLDAREKAQGQGISFYPARADGLNLPFKQQSFDAVFTMRFIRHYKKPERVKIYSEIYRVLKEQGLLIFEVLNSTVDKDAPNRPVHDEAYTFEEIIQELGDNGFSLQARLAGNIVKNPFFVVLKKWSLVSAGRWYARFLRSKKIHLNSASFWMVCATKLPGFSRTR